MFKPKMYRGVICHTLKNDVKFKEKLTCALKNNMWNLGNIEIILESPKISTLMGVLLTKVYNVLVKKVQKSYASLY